MGKRVGNISNFSTFGEAYKQHNGATEVLHSSLWALAPRRPGPHHHRLLSQSRKRALSLRMTHLAAFRVGQLYTNAQICATLKVENLGGIRPSVEGKKLRHMAILTAAEDSGKLTSDNPYHDRIEGDVLSYTAQGREGDQAIAGRNKRIIEQYINPAPFFGFINVGKQTYRFLGLLELLRHYPEVQTDRRGAMRRVWLFEFLIHDKPKVVPVEQSSAISATLLKKSLEQNPLLPLEREVTPLPQAETEAAPVSEAENVRSRLLQVPPYNFEHLIKHLMEASGFRDVSVTQASSDGGVDVNAYVRNEDDFFGGTHVQAQVKRWRHAVGSVEINKFRGALHTTAKGVFITTSRYTRAALTEAQHQFKPSITLIDGNRLSLLVIKHQFNIEDFE